MTCELQLRSYSVRNLEVYADFCMRAAYYLELSAVGPSALPKIIERWTVPRSNFVHKKSQENFERITRRREIRIIGGHPETVAAWLGFVKKHQYYGIGMRANVFDFSDLDFSKDMDAEAENISKKLAEAPKPILPPFRQKEAQAVLLDQPFKAQWGAFGAMGGNGAVSNRKDNAGRFEQVIVKSWESKEAMPELQGEAGLREEKTPSGGTRFRRW
jgi:small subunit ribosomal protein S10